MDSTALERDAVQFARLAVQRDHEGRYCEAVFYYKVSRGARLPSRRPKGRAQVPRRPGPPAFAFQPLLAHPALLLREEETCLPVGLPPLEAGLVVALESSLLRLQP